MINESNTTILRNEERATIFGIFEISNMIIKMGLTVLFLLVFSLSWYSQIVATLISSMLFSLIGIFYMRNRNYITMKFDIVKIKSILHISLPLIPHVLGGVVIAMSDRLFIEKMVSLKAVGIYSVGYVFGMVVMLFTDAFIKAWSPWFYKSLMNPTDSKKEKIVKYTYIYIISVFILAIVLSIIGKFLLPYVVDKKFLGANKFILWISIGYAIQGVYKIFFPYLVHIGRTSFLTFSTVIAAILNLLFNYIFIKEFGAIGAAYATIIAFLISAFLVFWYQQKYFYMPWRKK
jgi:O-antigen/teichoic acid export membrane protein